MTASEDMSLQLLGGYRCLERIAIGSTGVIWKAEARDKSLVAVKVLRAHLADNQEIKKDFAREFRLCHDFDHESLLRYLGLGVHGELPYTVMEYFASVNLRRILSGDKPKTALGKAASIITQTGQALQYIHEKGIIHRDIKPENILLNEASEVKLIDFSIAIAGAKKWLPFSRKASGSPSYIAPEQLRKEALTPAADIYAFGATIYEILTGRPPFTGEDHSEIIQQHLHSFPQPITTINKDITRDLDKLVQSMLAKLPDNRPHSMKEFLIRFAQAGIFREF